LAGTVIISDAVDWGCSGIMFHTIASALRGELDGEDPMIDQAFSPIDDFCEIIDFTDLDAARFRVMLEAAKKIHKMYCESDGIQSFEPNYNLVLLENLGELVELMSCDPRTSA
jgi:hypothetical protein